MCVYCYVLDQMFTVVLFTLWHLLWFITAYLVEGDGLDGPLSFKMTQWSCYCIGESVCYWLEKGNSMDT